jgi:hypothetical protein
VNQREIVDRDSEGAECRIVEVAKRLATQVKMTSQITPEYDPGKQSYGQALAEIRHEFTNYEQLLHELPICVDHWNAGGECVWDAEREPECPLGKEAHDIIKLSAKDLAEAEYRRWQE